MPAETHIYIGCNCPVDSLVVFRARHLKGVQPHDVGLNTIAAALRVNYAADGLQPCWVGNVYRISLNPTVEGFSEHIEHVEMLLKENHYKSVAPPA